MDSKQKREKAEQTTSGIVSLACYACYLYFLTHPDKAEEIKEWLRDKWNQFCGHVRELLDFWESLTSFSRRVEEIRSLPETDE